MSFRPDTRLGGMEAPVSRKGMDLRNNAVLNDTHFRAVVRLALRKHGLAVPRVGVARAVAGRAGVGQRLRDQVLPSALPAFATAGYEEVARADPYLWERLPHMLGFGYQQAVVLHRLGRGTLNGDGSAAELAAVFSAGIALADYLSDEVNQREGVGGILSPQAVHALFDLTADPDTVFAEPYRRVVDPRLRLLCALVASCGAGFRTLLARSANHAAWADLAADVAALYRAEAEASTARPASRDALRCLLSTVQAKSVLPFVVTCRITSLADPSPQPSPRAEAAARGLGQVVALADDLVDLPVDLHRGAANAVVLRLADRLAQRQAGWPSDADVYDVVDAVSGEIVQLLTPAALGVAGHDDDAAGSDVVQFACQTVAYWAGWLEDDPVHLRQHTPGSWATPGKPVLAATEMLLAQQRNGYREAVHHLRLPRVLPQGVSLQMHAGVLFQRAIVLDALLDAVEAGAAVPAVVLASEGVCILQAKHRSSPCGWNYVPEVPELPPDADDLAAVVNALSRLGGPALAATCDEAIWFALTAAGGDGGVPTWVLSPDDGSAGRAAADSYVELVGGQGVHPDVVSNLASGLLRYDPQRYRTEIGRTAEYLVSTQDSQGTWGSRWYAGPYYGTFRAVAVLAAVVPDSPAIDRARGFLTREQGADGDWGDPLATAFALLALHASGPRQDDPAVKRGLAHLVEAQEADGAWSASPFISFPSSDGSTPHVYASRTMTTAYCLKALVALSTGSGASAVLAGAPWPDRQVSAATARDWG